MIDILGAFGNVKLAWLKENTDNKFAIKAMKKKEIIDSKHVDHIENEKKILEQLEHPFIVRENIIWWYSLRFVYAIFNDIFFKA